MGTTPTTVATRTTYGGEKRKQVCQRTAAAAAAESMCTPSIDALAMAGLQCVPPEACCSDDDGMPPEHLRAFDAFLEKVVPVDMIMASRREEDARLRRGGRPWSYDDDVREKLKLWAKAVAEKTMRRR